MSKNQIEHPFDMKKDASGKLIPPTFLESEESGGTVTPVGRNIVPPEQIQQHETSVPEEVVDESTSEVLENPQTEESAPMETFPKKSYPPKEHNLRRLREELERERSEKDLMVRELEMFRRAGQNGQQNYQTKPSYGASPEEPQEIPELNIGDDDLVEGKHLKQYVQQMQRQMKFNSQQYAQQAAQAQQASLEIQLKAQYPDFDQVVNQANLKDLAAAYPELAATIHSASDLRSQAVTAYTMIKNLGIHTQEEDPYMADKERIKRNTSKPRPASSAAPTHSSPLSRASTFSGELTPALKQQLIKEMEDCRRR